MLLTCVPPGGVRGGGREHVRWEGGKRGEEEGVPKRLTVASVPALPGRVLGVKPRFSFSKKGLPARANWT